VRRGRGDGNGDKKTSVVCDGHALGPFAPLGVSAAEPFCGAGKGAIDEHLAEVQSATRVQICGERVEHAPQCAPLDPRLEAAMAGLIRRIPSGKSSNPRTALVPHAMMQPDAAFVVAHFEVRVVSTIMATLDALAITQLMFDLRSASCKAHRFAPRAHGRGLRGLTVPARSSRLGRYVMPAV
jgi:hypothetical protein